jgi:alkylation response protein AidB-like acyl-CoA dehydrogenase
MRFDFTDEQRQIQRSLRELLAREWSARAAWNGEVQTIWPKLADLGVLGVAVPESAGGIGGHALDWILLAEEAGRAALSAPLSDAFVAPSFLPPEWQEKLATGLVSIAVGLDGALMPDADLFILQRDGHLHLVERAHAVVRRAQSVDLARRLVRVEWTKSVPLDGDETIAFDRMALATAAELIGLSQQLLDTTVEYVKVRQQFGQAIGSFQAVKHLLADALLDLEFARPFVYRAAYSPTPANISMAKAAASDAAHHVTRAALQCHGAIGYSFEHDLHMWMKRAWALEAAWGCASWHRERIARAILDGETNEPSLYR